MNNVSWTQTKLGDIAYITKLAGYEFTKYFNSYQDSGEIVVLRGQNLKHGTLELDNVKTITKEISDLLPRSKLFKGDLVFAYVGTIGPVALIEENDKFHLGPNICKITPTKDILPKFLVHYFQSPLIRDEINKKISITAQPSLSMEKIREFNLKIPMNLAVQNNISSILDSLDVAIIKTNEIIKNIDALSSGVLDDLLVSNSVNKQKLSDIILFSQYGLSMKSNQEGKYPMLRMNNFLNGKIIPHPLVYVDLDSDSYNEYRLEKGDILFNRTNSQELVGKTGIFEIDGEYVFASYLVRLRANPKIILPEFLNYFMNSKAGKRQIETMKSRGVSQSNINPTILKSRFICPVPPLSAQKRIIKILKELDAKLSIELQQKEKLVVLKEGLMDDIFNQKVHIKE